MEKLGIEPKILLAQVINFVVLLVLFKKFLFKPFFTKLDEEEKRAKEEENKLKSYDKKEKELMEKKTALEAEYEKRLKVTYAKIKKEADEAKHEILKEAQSEAEELRKHTMALLEAEKQKSTVEIRREAYQIAVSLVERVLGESLSKELQKKITGEVMMKLPKIQNVKRAN
jgi:F-type H+-transporting ATPase subunit b